MSKIQKLGSLSNQSLQKASGKSWEEWITILDKAGLQETPHKEIVQWLWDNGYANDKGDPLSGWWAQGVVVGYEYHHGRRVKGETVDAGFEVGVQKTFPVSAGKLWEFLTSDEGLKLWLSPEASLDTVRFEKGSEYETPDGTKGKISSVYPLEKLRLSWQPGHRSNPTTLQLYLMDKNGKTSLGFHHEKLQDSADRETMKKHWQKVLETIAASLS